MGHRGITLVELLIVCCIVLILALIALPQFLEAETVAKMTLTRARMEAMEQATVMHYADWGSVYADFNDPIQAKIDYRVRNVDHPVCAQMQTRWKTCGSGPLSTAVPGSPFHAVDMHCPLTSPVLYIEPEATLDPFTDDCFGFGYDSRHLGLRITYGVFSSVGPDRIVNQWLRGTAGSVGLPYSPTNGTQSRGDYWGTVAACDQPETQFPDCNVVDSEFPLRRVYPNWETDISGDGIVDNEDLLMLLADWNRVSGPSSP